MKRSLALELLEHLTLCTTSLMLTALFVPYGTGLAGQMRRVENRAASCPHDFSLRSKESISASLSFLKNKGLVRTKGPKKKTIWFITAKGKQHFRAMDTKMGEDDLPPEDGKIRLVIYDIPEEMYTRRMWLRNRLSACDYRYLQKSVWVGTRPLPQKLRNELKERGLLRYVYIVGLDEHPGASKDVPKDV